jgi:hypothetical protein
MVQELLRLTFLSGRFGRFLRKKKGSYCEYTQRKSSTPGIKMKRSINEIESGLRRIKERLNNSNSHGEKRACDGVRNSRKQIPYIQVPAHTEYKGGGRSDIK